MICEDDFYNSWIRKSDILHRIFLRKREIDESGESRSESEVLVWMFDQLSEIKGYSDEEILESISPMIDDIR